MPKSVTRPLPARFVLLAAAAALALSLVFAMVVAESRDLDRRPVSGAVTPELRVDLAPPAQATEQAVSVSTP